MQIGSALGAAAQGIQRSQVDLQQAADRMLSSTQAIMGGESAPQLVDGGMRITTSLGDLPMLPSAAAIMGGESAPQSVDGGLRFVGPDGDTVTISAQALEVWGQQSMSDVFIDARMATYAFDGNLDVVEASQRNFAALLGIVA